MLSSLLLSSTLVLTAGLGAGGDVDFAPGGSSDRIIRVIADDSLSLGGSDGAGSRGGGERVCSFRGEEIECVTEWGVWSDSRACWVEVADPQPPLGDRAWGGRSDGVILSCYPPSPSGQPAYRFWRPGPAESVDPVDLAQGAVEQMRLVAPSVGMTPLREGAPMVVGVDAWLWVADPGPRSFGPISRSATAGSVTVTARARVDRVVWSMGDGGRVVCSSAGTPWTPQRGGGTSPTCGYRYDRPSSDQPGGVFRVRAAAHWVVDWSGGGQSGSFDFVLTGSREVRVTEVQVLITG